MHALSIQKMLTTLEWGFKIPSFVAGMFFLVFSLPTAMADEPLTAKELYTKMSLEQRVGQVFIWTYPGQSLTAPGATWLEKYQPGALIVFGRNIKSAEQIAKFNFDLQKFAAKKMRAPFFLMIDQEGGTVTRLKTQVPLPSALALGKMNDTKFMQKFGNAVAVVLKGLGFNVNLAPVLDISAPTKDSFIGSRTFGNDPVLVSERAGAYAEGLNEGGIMPTAKHFPGHGGVSQDSHHTTPKKLATYEELADRDLVPFEDFAQAEFPRAVMMAHIALPNVDPSGVPSTYSKILIQDYLREKLGFDGLVITDDLEMAGATPGDDIGEHAVQAFLAGNDMLLLAGVGARQKQAFNKVLEAVRSGRVSEARLRESVERILAYKLMLALAPRPFNKKLSKDSVATLESLSKQVQQKNFHLALESKSASWPQIKPETHTLVLGSEHRFFNSFQKSFLGKATFFHLTPQSLGSVEHELEKVPYDLIIYYASGVQTARWLVRLTPAQRAKTVVINSNHDAEVESQGAFLSVLNVGTHCPECGTALGSWINTPEIRAPAQEPEPVLAPPITNINAPEN